MKSLIPWDDKPATVSTTTFKRIKDYVLGLKEEESAGEAIVTPEDLRGRLEATDLILAVYGISHQHPAVVDLRDSLRGLETR